MLSVKVQENNYILWLGAILVVFVILSFPGSQGRSLYAYSETLRDLAVVNSLHSGHIVLIGPPSSLGGFYFGPAYYYLLFPFAFFSGFTLWSLSLASIFYASLTIVLIFFVVKSWWKNSLLAILAAGLTATSTLTTQFAKYASNPNFIPFFSLLFFYSLERLLGGGSATKKIYYVLLLAFSFGIAIQLHAVPLVCLPLILLALLWRGRLKLNLVQWVLFFFVTIVLNSPYLYYELTHNFGNLTSLLHIASGQSTYTPLWEHLVQYIGFWVSSIVSSNSFFNVAFILGRSFYICWVVILAGVYFVFKYNHKNLKPKSDWLTTPPSVRLILGYWLVIPSIILLLPLGALNGLRIYYFFILSPLVFILLALGLWRMWYTGYTIVVLYILSVYLLMQIGQALLYRLLTNNLTT